MKNFLTLKVCQFKKNDYLYYVIKMREMTPRQVALKDIAEMLSVERQAERLHYHNNKEIYTIDYYGPQGAHYEDHWYESYILPTHMLDTKENRRLNRELGI